MALNYICYLHSPLQHFTQHRISYILSVSQHYRNQWSHVTVRHHDRQFSLALFSSGVHSTHFPLYYTLQYVVTLMCSGAVVSKTLQLLWFSRQLFIAAKRNKGLWRHLILCKVEATTTVTWHRYITKPSLRATDTCHPPHTHTHLKSINTVFCFFSGKWGPSFLNSGVSQPFYTSVFIQCTLVQNHQS